MATPKRGPMKVDLHDGNRKTKMDVEYIPLLDRYVVKIGKREYEWTASEFASHFRRWLMRQKEKR